MVLVVLSLAYFTNLYAHAYFRVAYISEKWEEIKRPIT